MPALFLALAASLFYGTADFLGGVATRRAGALTTSVVSQSTGLVVITVLAWTLGWTRVSQGDLAWGVAAGVTGVLGLLLLYRGLADGPMSVVAPITALCSLALPALVGLTLGERPRLLVLIGVAIAGLAVVLVSRPRTTGAVGERDHLARAVAISVLSGILIAAFLVCFERTSRAAGFWPLVAARLSSMAMIALMIAIRGHRTITFPRDGRWLVLPLVSGTLDNVANVLYTAAVREDLLSIIAPVASLYPAATVLLARVVLAERLSHSQGAGLLAAALAVGLMTIGR